MAEKKKTIYRFAHGYVRREWFFPLPPKAIASRNTTPTWTRKRKGDLS